MAALSDLALLSPAELEERLRLGLRPDAIVCRFANLTLSCYFASLGSLGHLQILKQWGADFNIRNRIGRTPLTEAEFHYVKTGAPEFLACTQFLRPDTVEGDSS